MQRDSHVCLKNTINVAKQSDSDWNIDFDDKNLIFSYRSLLLLHSITLDPMSRQSDKHSDSFY